MKGAAGNGRNAVQLPLLLTTAIHLGALLLALVAPKLVPEPPRIPKVYQVELYTAPEVQLGHQPASPPGQVVVDEPPGITTPPPPPTTPPKAQTKPALSTPVPPPARPKAVSLSPLKKQLARETRDREEQTSRDQQLNDRFNQIAQKQKIRQTEAQSQSTKHAGVTAVADFYRATSPNASQKTTRNTGQPQAGRIGGGTAGAPPPSGIPTSLQLEAQAAYRGRLQEHLRRNWKLPVLQDWDENLRAKIVIKIKNDGSVITTWFEKHSNNSRFDQYVKKAVDRSSPLPPLPREFEQKSEEIAVTFTPGGLN